jgi:hypothetical protein
MNPRKEPQQEPYSQYPSFLGWVMLALIIMGLCVVIGLTVAVMVL